MPETMTPQPLMQIMAGFWSAKTLATAVELDLFNWLEARGGATVTETATAQKIAERPTELLLTACASLGLLEVREGTYRNSILVEEYLVSGKPYYFGGWVQYLDQHDYPGWMRLIEGVRNNRPTAWDPDTQDSLFEDRDQVFLDTFWDGMYSLSSFTAHRLGQVLDLTDSRALLDVGGGGGAYDIELCRQYPQLRATVYDKQFVCELTQRRIDDAGLADRITTVVGDFLTEEELPAGHDTILLSMILHDWAEADCQKILAKCFAALPPGGRLLISELLVNDTKDGPADAALMSLAMLVETWGRNYTAAEYTSWLDSAGFAAVTTLRYDAPGANGVVIAHKPS